MRFKLKSFVISLLIGIFIFICFLLSYCPTVRKFCLLSNNNSFDERLYVEETKLTDEKDAYKRHKFNQWTSDKIPLNRYIPDSRHIECSNEDYEVNGLPLTSIVITFHNEARSTLLRTIKSVIKRSRWELIKEIVLVDDYSDNALDGEMLISISPKIKLIRNKRREGLIRSRMVGVRATTGEVLTFLDSHCEVNKQWLTPLLAALKYDVRKLVSPVIDIINFDTFQYIESSTGVVGGFDWSMRFKWDVISNHDFLSHQKTPTKPIKTPIISGGIFSIRKKWFMELGQYDPQLEIWGGENFEISFKTWMCGGKMEIIPCSRVGHVFRKEHPYSFPDGNGITYLRNIQRIAEVWMDSYKRLVYRSRGYPKTVKLKSVSERKQLRRSLHCKSFHWYLRNVYSQLRIPNAEEAAYGELKQLKSSVLCITDEGATIPTLQTCHSKKGDQEWIMTKSGLIRSAHTGNCLTATKSKTADWNVAMVTCNNKDYLQHWKLMIRQRIRHDNSNLCLEYVISHFIVAPCKEKFNNQQWKFTVQFFY